MRTIVLPDNISACLVSISTPRCTLSANLPFCAIFHSFGLGFVWGGPRNKPPQHLLSTALSQILMIIFVIVNSPNFSILYSMAIGNAQMKSDTLRGAGVVCNRHPCLLNCKIVCGSSWYYSLPCPATATSPAASGSDAACMHPICPIS